MGTCNSLRAWLKPNCRQLSLQLQAKSRGTINPSSSIPEKNPTKPKPNQPTNQPTPTEQSYLRDSEENEGDTFLDLEPTDYQSPPNTGSVLSHMLLVHLFLCSARPAALLGPHQLVKWENNLVKWENNRLG